LAACRSSSLNLICAISIRARACSLSSSGARLAILHSVTTYCVSCLGTVTLTPSVRQGAMSDVVPPWAVLGRMLIALHPSDREAPITKSSCPRNTILSLAFTFCLMSTPYFNCTVFGRPSSRICVASLIISSIICLALLRLFRSLAAWLHGVTSMASYFN